MLSHKIIGTVTVLALLLPGRPAGAQSRDPSAADNSVSPSNNGAPAFSGGVTAGAMSFTGGRNEQAMSLLLQFRPLPWLSLSAAPGFGRTAFGTLSSSGLTDIPLGSVARYSAVNSTWSPSFFGSLSAVISPGQSGTALGIGRTSVAVGTGISVSPVDHTYLSADASRPLTTATGNGSADFWVSQSLGRFAPSLGYSAEIGAADSAATLARSVAGGVAFQLDGGVSLAVDGTHGLTSGAPKWTFSVSIGSAFSGISPMTGGSLFGRLKTAFGSRATSSSGYSRKSGSTASCKRLGTC